MKDKIFGVFAARGTQLYAAHCTAAWRALLLGSSFCRNHAGGLWPEQRHHPVPDLHHSGRDEPDRQRRDFNNLALLFAMGVAIGMARKEKEVAALSVQWLIIMNHSHSGHDQCSRRRRSDACQLHHHHAGHHDPANGCVPVVSCRSRAWRRCTTGFYKIELPPGGPSLAAHASCPSSSSIVYLVVGIAMFYISGRWCRQRIAALGALVLASGYAGTFIYGLLERALIPFGLHHVFYMPFWQTAVGGTAIIDSVTVTGAQNIFFAEPGLQVHHGVLGQRYPLHGR